MSKINDLLVAETEKYVSALLSEKLPEKIIYHNLDHTLQVRQYAETIGGNSGLDPDEMNILRICALFHETGYVNSYDLYNEESIVIATSFLTEKGIDQQTIDRIAEIIRSAKRPQSPKDKISEVLCDADMMFLADDNAIEQFDLRFDERTLHKLYPEKRPAYEKKRINSYTIHTYFTEYGRTVLQPKKEATIKRLSERLERRKVVEVKENTDTKSIFYSRGVETMFRITARNQINLNSIADNKSNILISVNAIIISIIITMLAGNIGNMSKDIFPILIFLIICLITIIIAILSTRPNLVTRRFTKEDLEKKNVDLIFFGNFCKMDFDEYLNEVRELMKDDDHLYSTLIQNQYSLGKILAKKFRLVRIAYNVFMVGIIITVIAFLVNYILIRGTL
jgi:predicted metal-dependent HD superfamily phosphohydrolase